MLRLQDLGLSAEDEAALDNPAITSLTRAGNTWPRAAVWSN